jgi:hypothetical protein
MDSVIWSRLQRIQIPAMPKFEKNEGSADLFIHVVRTLRGTDRSFIVERVQSSCGRLLQKEAKAESFRDPTALGELMYLAARIEAGSAITPVAQIVSHEQSTILLPNRETLRTRAVRVLLGLLASHRADADAFHQDLFRKALDDLACVAIAVTGLVGLFGESKQHLLSELQSKGIRVSEGEVDISLRITGLAA